MISGIHEFKIDKTFGKEKAIENIVFYLERKNFFLQEYVADSLIRAFSNMQYDKNLVLIIDEPNATFEIFVRLLVSIKTNDEIFCEKIEFMIENLN